MTNLQSTRMSQVWRPLVEPVACCDILGLPMKPPETHHYRGMSRSLLFDHALTGDLQDTV